ncbi:MAG: 5-amino-6-(D-ribitylamino)uracil--L-tyrosine 4-hydroxyphenyl transferase CofH [Actinomycetota bacterium]|nr:5-amino-6-(D-ribitylamino)uracil--L-tyrosine 4-hydroxyphenyl transferase CofH [Actinomycetota bacterium]MED5277321.1 5-amino-6-(D-ribitylamino)uracil--L-tyrosine 4-hydroxyphenyl transferase CofH [Actinomycetota bacterium]
MSIDEIENLPLEDLFALASSIRTESFRNTVTYSPKVFIPLTKLCQDRCGYCTFAEPPARLESPFMEPEEVLEVAQNGLQAGCNEALFTLGERPELRYPYAKEWLAKRGYDSTVEYLVEMSRLVLEETGLLPHSNAGALYHDELLALRDVSASQGMMLESVDPNLNCHRNSPDKTPDRRISTLKKAGELRIPFTTGILVGIGENRESRIESLKLIAEIQKEFGHIQEVIIQNFLPKLGTAMHKHEPCPENDFLEAIALARIILPKEVHIQAPPNLSDDLNKLLKVGIDDWGGVSPVTKDYVNPERPWPDLEKLRQITENEGFELASRLTIYPEFASNLKEWVSPELFFPVMELSDSSGYARSDPLNKLQNSNEIKLDDSEESSPIDSVWFSGSPGYLPLLIHSSKKPKGELKNAIAAVEAGEEADAEMLELFLSARGSEISAVAELADQLRKIAVGDKITWVANRNINYTNVCTFKCRFCGFSKGPLSLNLRGTPYLLEMDEIAARVAEAARAGATEVCLQGGIHPDFDGNYYIEVTKAVRDAVPDIHVHGFTALEVFEGARRLSEPLDSYLKRLMEAGLASLPGTAAEILDDEIRQDLCPDKINTEEWLEVHRTAHQVGLRSNVTMMFGSIEHPRHWVKHLLLCRDLQKETAGFTEFVGLPFVHMASPIYLQKKSRRGPTFRETLLLHAVARIAYHGLIPNIQASWVKIGFEGVSQLLQAGVNDLGGTLIDENISRAAGAQHGQMVNKSDFETLVKPLGRQLVQRNTLYGTVEPNKKLEINGNGRTLLPVINA